MPEISPDDLIKLTEKVFCERGLDFRDYKPASLTRRTIRRLDATKCQDIHTYIQYLDTRPNEYAKLIGSLLINVTQFHRDAEAWRIIKEEVIPQIVSEKKPSDQIRMWSAGCATGEEAYSLAISLVEVVGPSIADYDVKIYATDIDDEALAIARKGEYSDDSISHLPSELRDRYFTRTFPLDSKAPPPKDGHIRGDNLATDAPIPHLDLIACRNVLIYMSGNLQSHLLSNFHYGLERDGYLFLGKAKSLFASSNLFRGVNDRCQSSRRNPYQQTTNYEPAIPRLECPVHFLYDYLQTMRPHLRTKVSMGIITQTKSLRTRLVRRLILKLAITYSSAASCPGSTVGHGGLNYRVRDGNGCTPSGKVTSKPLYISSYWIAT